MPKADDTTVADTSVDETSTNEETPDPEAELEDSDISFDDGDETEEADDSKDEKTDTEPAESEEESTEDGETEETEAESEDETEESDESKSDDTKEVSNKDAAARRIAEKQAREARVKEEQQKYIAEADPEDPTAAAVRQLQVDAYNNKVERNSNTLTNGYEKALTDFPILRDPKPEIQAELDAAIDAFQAQNVTIDAYGNPVDVRGDLYQFLQSKADSIAKLTGIRAKQQEKSKSKEKSKTFTPPSKAPKEAKSDPMMDGFDEEAAKP